MAQAFVRGDAALAAAGGAVPADRGRAHNYRLALAASLDRGDADEGLRICSAMRNPWVTYGDVSEGVGLVRPVPRAARGGARAGPRPGPGAPRRPGLRAAGLRHRGRCAQAGLELCRRPGTRTRPGALRLLAAVSLRAGRHGRGAGQHRGEAAAPRRAGNVWEEGLALSIKAAALARQGRLREAQRHLRGRAGGAPGQQRLGRGPGPLRARRAGPGPRRPRWPRSAISRRRWACTGRSTPGRRSPGAWPASPGRAHPGRPGPGPASLTESLQLSLATGQRLAVARGLEAFAALEARAGDPARAARLAGRRGELRAAAMPRRQTGPGWTTCSAPARKALGEPHAGRAARRGPRR